MFSSLDVPFFLAIAEGSQLTAASLSAYCELWFEVERCFVAAVHVEWHGRVLMHGNPLAALLSEAYSRADPDAGLLPVCPGAANPVEAGAERHAVARCDAQIADLESNRPSERREPFLQALPVRVRSTIEERGREVIQQEVRRPA
jgi:hypothetical protein